MDTGRGEFTPVSDTVAKTLKDELKDASRVFTIGQVVEVNGSRFKVVKIAKKRLNLKLLADVN